jgi:hypothetical protein
MIDRFNAISTESTLSRQAARELDDKGFVVIDGPFPPESLSQLADSYDRAMSEADPADISIGRTTTRAHCFVNRAEFDDLYVYLPLLEACCKIIAQPFKLSALAGRTLHPGARSQDMHVDFASDDFGWPMVGFILMIDEFRSENGATQFLPGSHNSQAAGGDCLDTANAGSRLISACGEAGSLIVYNGSVLHGHGVNLTGECRRSIQGAFIRRTEKSSTNLPSRVHAETLERIGPLARYLVSE